MIIENENAYEITFDDPDGVFGRLVDAGQFWIVGEETAKIRVTIDESCDPEATLFYSDSDGKFKGLAENMSEKGYYFEVPVDTKARTGYSYTDIVLYGDPDAKEPDIFVIMIFANEEETDQFVNEIRQKGINLAGWHAENR